MILALSIECRNLFLFFSIRLRGRGWGTRPECCKSIMAAMMTGVLFAFPFRRNFPDRFRVILASFLMAIGTNSFSAFSCLRICKYSTEKTMFWRRILTKTKTVSGRWRRSFETMTSAAVRAMFSYPLARFSLRRKMTVARSSNIFTVDEIKTTLPILPSNYLLYVWKERRK